MVIAQPSDANNELATIAQDIYAINKNEEFLR
jgi:hypothetical protein